MAKRLKIEQMLDKLSNLHSHAMTKIQTLVDTYYAFYRWPNTSDYVINLMEKNKFLCNNIEIVNNKNHYYRSFVCKLTNYIKG